MAKPGATGARFGLQSEYRPLKRVLLRHPRDAFRSQSSISRQWRQLNYIQEPNFSLALEEYEQFTGLLERLGAKIEYLESEDDLGLDSLYVRDASVVSSAGAILCTMGKQARSAEPRAQGVALENLGFPVHSAIEFPGTVEGGDTAWLDHKTLAVGRSYRTNAEGIYQLRSALEPLGVEVLVVDLPHFRGQDDVFHLMSVLSPLDEDLLLVYSPLLPVSFRERLLSDGFQLVEVPEEEFYAETQGCNVLAVGPRVVVAIDGNLETKRRMEAAGCEVHTYAGAEISVKGGGGPTCLTKPLERA
ncbi:amidinotransferase [Chloropicon roscoffensis]|uniref:Amidinotransferase n=1 Tax=Chloropicon roscoffensis TaxID=1461544 RepID=A0AAX4P867_9CHLO